MLVEASDVTYVTYKRSGYPPIDTSQIITKLHCKGNGKPEVAWWGSPENAYYGWKEWCEGEDYGNYDWDNPIKWKLEKGSKIFQIDFPEVKEINESNPLIEYLNFFDIIKGDVEFTNGQKLAQLNNRTFSNLLLRIDFEKMKRDGIVAIELMNACIGHYFINKLETFFNGWDCESICVLDPSKIIWL